MSHPKVASGKRVYEAAGMGNAAGGDEKRFCLDTTQSSTGLLAPAKFGERAGPTSLSYLPFSFMFHPCLVSR